VLDRQPPRDRAAEGVAHQVCALDAELLDQCRDVVGQVLGAQRPIDVGGAAMPLQVGHDHTPPLGQSRSDRVEDLAARDSAVQQDQRRAAGAVLVVVELQPVDVRPAHRAQPLRTASR